MAESSKFIFPMGFCDAPKVNKITATILLIVNIFFAGRRMVYMMIQVSALLSEVSSTREAVTVEWSRLVFFS